MTADSTPGPALAPAPLVETRESRDRAAEIKFVLDRVQAAAVMAWARGHLIADPHGSGDAGDLYHTSTIYVETRDFDVFHRRGSFKRAKYRVRRYGASSVVFLERKLRTRRLLAKRRSIVPVADIERLALAKADRTWPGAWFHHRLLMRRLHPVAQVNYERVARVTATPYGLARLTLDDNIRTLPSSHFAFVPNTGLQLIPAHVILELKFRFTMPAVFKTLIETFCLEPAQVSKYRLAVSALELPCPPS